ncbi:MAG TPA: hypothetical protein VF476_08955 [Chitinophagaceae bacterium]
MEELFPRASHSLSLTATAIATEMVKLFPGDRVTLSEDQWTEYGDNLEWLHGRLQQLQAIVNTEYQFDEGLPNDVINYNAMLKELETPLTELVGFLLSRGDFMPDAFTRSEVQYLQEILEGIIQHSARINELLSF